METNSATSTTITYERQPYKITINLDECEGIVVIENGEEMDIREYIRRIVKEVPCNAEGYCYEWERSEE